MILKLLSMKTIKPFLIIIVFFLISSLLFFSCRVSKTPALRCPQVLTKKNNEVLAKYKRDRNTAFTPKYSPTIRKQSVRQLISLTKKNHGNNIDVFNNSRIHKNVMVSAPVYLNGISKIEYTKRLTASIDEKVIPLRKNYPDGFLIVDTETAENQSDVVDFQTSGCDTIILKSGIKIPGKVHYIGQDEILFYNCDDTSLSVISLLKSDVLAIIHSNGTRDSIISANVSLSSADITKRGTESLGIAGSFLSLVGLVLSAILIKEYFIAAIIIAFLTGVIGIVFGTLSLIKILRHSHNYKGKFFAILSIGIGAFDIVMVILSFIILLFIWLIIWAFSPKG
jgi:hypothetical protein